MASWIDKTPNFDWKELQITDADWDSNSPEQLREMLLQLYLIRDFEMSLLALKDEDLIHGPVHTSVGQEAVAVGAAAGLLPADGIGGTHRAHHQYLAKAMSFHLADGFDPTSAAIPSEVQQCINTLMAEVMGLAPGCCGGRGGSMHLCDPDIGVLGTNAIVGGGIPVATGAAWAERFNKTGNVVVSFFGDGAINQGAFHEALNLAGLWKVPIIYVLENNGYAVATSQSESAPINDLSIRAAAYGMSGWVVDGNDPLAMKIAIETAAASMREDGMPVFIEAQTFRWYHHAGGIPGSAFGYRTKEEEEEWLKRDPVANFRAALLKRKILTKAQDSAISEAAKQAVLAAEKFCTQQDSSGARIINPAYIPADETLHDHLRGDGAEFAEIKFTEPESLDTSGKMKYVDAISSVTGRWLEKDPTVYVCGEEVGHMKGGPYLATKGLSKKYPGRVIDTPISEAGFCGLACGAAMNGCRPIAEIMFPDFALVAADQLFNQIGRLRHMYGGRVKMPLVIRTRIAIGCGYGGQHSMDPTALFALFPGWQIVAPTTAADYIGLFNSAMHSTDPVLIVEHHELYNKEGAVPAGNLDYFIELGKAKKVREGGDVTLLAYSQTLDMVCQAADELAAEGISADVIDLRTVSMPDLDYDMIGESFSKTMVMLIVEQAPASASIGPRIAAECQKRFFDSLDAPILTLAGADVPYPVSRTLEASALPTVQDVKAQVRRLVRREV